jgi:DhnA family fructose-bisphosphate aldolase class Ia
MLRMKEFFNGADRRSLMVDVSAGLVLGALPGLEDFEAALRPFLPLVDGAVCAPGRLRGLEDRTKQEAGLLMRMDWSNSPRGKDFVLSPAQIHQFQLFSAKEASDFGAVGMVISFLLGYEEDIEAACMKATVTLALDGKAVGMPLVVEVCPNGPRVSLPGKAVELGASYALEGGADAIAVPYPGTAAEDDQPVRQRALAAQTNELRCRPEGAGRSAGAGMRGGVAGPHALQPARPAANAGEVV